MRPLATLLFALLAFASPEAHAQNAPPVTFFGEFAPTAATTTLPATNGAVTARNAFLQDLDPASVSFFDFEGLTPTFTDATARPPRAAPGTLVDRALARFDGYGSTSQIPARVFARSSQIANMSNRTGRNIDGGWATSGDQFLYAVGYDGSNGTVNLPAGQTSVAVSIRYDPTATTAGRTARPFSAFGGYVIDTEGYEFIRLTLTPLGGGTPVVLDYGPVSNSNNGTADPRGLFPGNYQVAFVGFTDHDTQYQRIDISFFDRDQSVVGDESFAFDDFVVGELNQVNGPPQTPETDRVLNQVDEPGWRLLSAPVRGVTVDDLAQQNLVQGVAAGDGVRTGAVPRGRLQLLHRVWRWYALGLHPRLHDRHRAAPWPRLLVVLVRPRRSRPTQLEPVAVRARAWSWISSSSRPQALS